MFSPLLACLALGIGLNASILPSSEVKGISMSNTINEINVQQCEMGSYKTKKTPSASPEVHGTSSIPCKGGELSHQCIPLVNPNMHGSIFDPVMSFTKEKGFLSQNKSCTH